MTTIFFVLIIIVSLLFIVGVVIFVQARKIFREQKNIERSLKMVPIRINLPPPSDDIESNGRDERDVNEEVISKAETIYNILSSAIPNKNFKTSFYGQKHLAFEIVSRNGFIDFYAMVPVSMLEIVKQAVTGAYPTSKLEEDIEPNIFNQTGKSDAVLGGEMELKQSFSYPIAVYQEIKRDPMLPLLSSLSSFKKEDGAVVQLLLRPTTSDWIKTSHSLANKKRKGNDKSQGFMDFLKLIITSFAKPPEESKNEHSLSSFDQSVVDSIDDKTRSPGFEVVIRLIVASSSLHRSQEILNNIVATFSIFNSPSKNSFKFKKSDNIEQLIEDYIMRNFGQDKKKMILNSVELATLYHFPDQKNLPNSQVKRQDSRQIDAPPNLPSQGLLLGVNDFRGVQKPVYLSLTDRQRHIYVVGQTGVGKSTFLENLALQDMVNNKGFAFIDPHGDTVDRLMSMTPAERAEDIIYFSPAEMERPLGLNLFEFDKPDEKDFIIQESINMLYKLYDPNHQGILGPRYEKFFRMAALTIMADPNKGSFIDVPKLFIDNVFLRSKLKYVQEMDVLDFWNKEVPQSSRSNDYGEIVAWVTSKFSAFSSNTMMRHIIGQAKTSFKIREVMDNQKILLVNLNRSRVGAINSQLLGMILVMKFQEAAMSRSDIPESERKDFCLFVDEFQNFSTDSFADIMSEARKYHLNLVVANQYTTQLSDEIRNAVFGNVGTVVTFRVGHDDAKVLGEYFKPTFKEDDLIRLPNYNTIIKTMINGVPAQSFSMVGLPTLGKPNPKLEDALKKLSLLKYGRSRKEVEEEINLRLSSDPPKLTSSLDSFLQTRNQELSKPSQPVFANNDNKPFGDPPQPIKTNPLSSQLNNTSDRPIPNQINDIDQETIDSLEDLSHTSFVDSFLSKKRKKQNLQKTAQNNQPLPKEKQEEKEVNSKSSLSPAADSPTIINPDKYVEVNKEREHEFKIDRNLNNNISSSSLDQQEIQDVSRVLKNDYQQTNGFSDNPSDQNDQDTEIIIDQTGHIVEKD